MKISKNGKKLIKTFEGLRLKAYYCPAGVLTIGYGHTKGVYQNQEITTETANKFFDEDIKVYVNMVNTLVTVPLSQGQFDALVSFTYNCGINNFRNSTLLKLLNKNDYSGAAAQFVLWNKIRRNGKLVPCEGLTNRRKAEREMFLSKTQTLLNADEAAKILGISRRTVYSWANQHKIKHIRYSDRLLFEPEDIYKFKKEHIIL
ncbi:glycoside hydrolase family protein [bacterium]|nr:glycoside hydrolase family protein [bacterium]